MQYFEGKQVDKGKEAIYDNSTRLRNSNFQELRIMGISPAQGTSLPRFSKRDIIAGRRIGAAVSKDNERRIRRIL